MRTTMMMQGSKSHDKKIDIEVLTVIVAPSNVPSKTIIVGTA